MRGIQRGLGLASQKASNVENVTIWRCPHVVTFGWVLFKFQGNLFWHVLAENKAKISVLHYWCLMSGIHQWLLPGFPSQRASNAESVFMSWHYHVLSLWQYSLLAKGHYCKSCHGIMRIVYSTLITVLQNKSNNGVVTSWQSDSGLDWRGLCWWPLIWTWLLCNLIIIHEATAIYITTLLMCPIVYPNVLVT